MAPIVLIISNRPNLTTQVFDRIRDERPKELLIIADGPREDRPEDKDLTQQCRKTVTSPDWPCSLETNFSEINLGCRSRIASGLKWVFSLIPEAIVLEDDCLPSKGFFSFCSELLDHYRTDTRVMHISGDNFQGRWRGTGSYYFSRYAHTWGWATWRRAFKYYDENLSEWPQARKDHILEQVFSNPKEVRYWRYILEQTHLGNIDTWDYQWLFALWMRSGLSILPNENLVTKIGAGPDALHSKDAHSTIGIPTAELGQIVHPDAVVTDKEADSFTFVRHIFSPVPTAFQKIRARLAIRTRIKSLYSILLKNPGYRRQAANDDAPL